MVVRPKREAASKALAKTRQLNLIDENEHLKEISEDEYVIGDEFTVDEKEDVDKEESSDESPETVSLDAKLKNIKPTSKRGRPPKDETPRVNTSSKGGYKKITDFERLTPGARDISFWIECIEEARPVKRGGARTKGESRISSRPPVDIVQVRNIKVPSIPLHIDQNTERNSDHVKSSKMRDSGTAVIFNEKQYTIPAMTSIEIDGVILLNTGSTGGVSSMDWSPFIDGCGHYLAIANYPLKDFTGDYMAIPAEPMNESSPISLFTLVDGEFIIVDTLAIDSLYVRSLSWSPFPFIDENGVVYYLLVALYSDGIPRLWSVPTDGKSIPTSPIITFSNEEDIVVTTVTWCPIASDANLLALGTTNGSLSLWRISSITPTCIATVRPVDQPIRSISYNPTDPLVLLVGIHGSPAFIWDVREPYEFIPIHSSLSLIPIVAWPSFADACLVADSDANVRAYPGPDPSNTTSFPIATFPHALSSIALSPFHNILAFGSFDGAVHYSIMDVERRCILVEKQILQFSLIDQVQISTLDDVPSQVKPPVSIPSRNNAISKLVWSTSSKAPGYLAISSPSSPIITILPIDHLVLLKD